MFQFLMLNRNQERKWNANINLQLASWGTSRSFPAYCAVEHANAMVPRFAGAKEINAQFCTAMEVGFQNPNSRSCSFYWLSFDTFNRLDLDTTNRRTEDDTPIRSLKAKATDLCSSSFLGSQSLKVSPPARRLPWVLGATTTWCRLGQWHRQIEVKAD